MSPPERIFTLADARTPLPEWSAEIPAAMDYGLLGLPFYSLQSNFWSHMCRTYAVIRAALLEVEDAPGGFLSRLRERVERDPRRFFACLSPSARPPPMPNEPGSPGSGAGSGAAK